MKLDKPIYVVCDANGECKGVYSNEDAANSAAKYYGAYVSDHIHLIDIFAGKTDTYIEEEVDGLTEQLAAANTVIDIARKFVSAGDERKERTKAFQTAASIARKGGPKGSAVIKEVERKHPIVHDVGDAYDAIKAAITNYDKR